MAFFAEVISYPLSCVVMIQNWLTNALRDINKIVI